MHSTGIDLERGLQEELEKGITPTPKPNKARGIACVFVTFSCLLVGAMFIFGSVGETKVSASMRFVNHLDLRSSRLCSLGNFVARHAPGANATTSSAFGSSSTGGMVSSTAFSGKPMDEKCPICFGDDLDRCKVRLPCNHDVCVSCICELIDRNAELSEKLECPLCREKFTKEAVGIAQGEGALLEEEGVQEEKEDAQEKEVVQGEGALLEQLKQFVLMKIEPRPNDDEKHDIYPPQEWNWKASLFRFGIATSNTREPTLQRIENCLLAMGAGELPCELAEEVKEIFAMANLDAEQIISKNRERNEHWKIPDALRCGWDRALAMLEKYEEELHPDESIRELFADKSFCLKAFTVSCPFDDGVRERFAPYAESLCKDPEVALAAFRVPKLGKDPEDPTKQLVGSSWRCILGEKAQEYINTDKQFVQNMLSESDSITETQQILIMDIQIAKIPQRFFFSQANDSSESEFDDVFGRVVLGAVAPQLVSRAGGRPVHDFLTDVRKENYPRPCFSEGFWQLLDISEQLLELKENTNKS